MGVDAVTESTDVEISFTSDDPAATFRCSLDTGGDLWVACTSPFQQTGLTLGTHEFLVAAVGPGGNVDPTPAAYEWDIGYTTPPSVEITSGPARCLDGHHSDVRVRLRRSGGRVPVLARRRTAGRLRVGQDLHARAARGRQRQRRRRPHLHRHGAQAAPARRSDGGRVAVRGRGSHRAGDRVPDAAARADVDQPARGLRLPHERARRGHRVLARRRAVQPAAQIQPDLLAEISADLPGEHTLRARAIDPSGNFDATPLSHTWTVVGEPVVTISDGPGDASGAEIVAEIPDTRRDVPRSRPTSRASPPSTARSTAPSPHRARRRSPTRRRSSRASSPRRKAATSSRSTRRTTSS